MNWTKAQLQTFTQRAKDRVGDGWYILGPELQAALLAKEALSILLTQTSESIAHQDIRDLYHGMLDAKVKP